MFLLSLSQKTRTLYWSNVATPLGGCIVMGTEAGICWVGTPGAVIDEGLTWTRRWHTLKGTGQVPRVVEGEGIGPLQQAGDELRQYFAGERVQFSCPLDLHGTPFQLSVWQEVGRIPYGETRSYRDIAHTIGRPAASRAVGAANGANPAAIIIPCHRVLGSDGSLTGYGGGLSTKSWLLSLEGVARK